jgi:hypothetical protein
VIKEREMEGGEGGKEILHCYCRLVVLCSFLYDINIAVRN